MCQVLYENKYITLSTLGSWLLAHTHEDLVNPPKRIGGASRAYHHSTIVVDVPMTGILLHEYLFHLRRAKGQINRPPPSTEFSKTDKIIQPRQNRFIGLSREGVVSLSWPSTRGIDDFEAKAWPDQFQGLYLILHLHVQGEKGVLSELAHLSAKSGDRIRRIILESHIAEISRERKSLVQLVSIMIQYTLQMSSEDCGGLSEYVSFFSSLREVFSIADQRKELSSELRDVLQLIESNYYEEQRRLKALNREHEFHLQSRRTMFDATIAVVSAVVIPFLVVSGVFGMNNRDGPMGFPFVTVMGIAAGLSAVLLVVFLSMLYRVHSYTRHRREVYKKKFKV
jgi:hypothetical protein